MLVEVKLTAELVEQTLQARDWRYFRCVAGLPTDAVFRSARVEDGDVDGLILVLLFYMTGPDDVTTIRPEYEVRPSGPYGSDPQPTIVTPCPSCGSGIFIGSGGHLTCARLGCKSPSVETTIDEMKAALERYRAAEPQVELAQAAIENIVALADRDGDGPKAPRLPFSWRTIALMALDLAFRARVKP